MRYAGWAQTAVSGPEWVLINALDSLCPPLMVLSIPTTSSYFVSGSLFSPGFSVFYSVSFTVFTLYLAEALSCCWPTG